MDEEQIVRIIKENMQTVKKGRFRKREAYEQAMRLMDTRQIISIVGVRRCGKSTLMKMMIRNLLKSVDENNILYLNLEHPFFNQFKNDPYNLLKIYEIFRKRSKGKVYLFLDEIQFFKDWQVFVKHIYEKDESKIVITGSNSKLLSSELATILSGRTIPITLYPFSFKESGLRLREYLKIGGFPEIVIQKNPALAEIYYKNILYQDVIPRFVIKNSLAIETLSFYLISNTGKEISYNTLKSITKLDDKTVKQYTSYLEDANLLYVINNFDFSLKKMVGNRKKAYCVDNVFSEVSFRNSPDLGRLFENMVFMHLKRYWPEIYFHKGKGECDFLVKHKSRILFAVQACIEMTEENSGRETEGLREAMEEYGLSSGLIVTKRQNKTLGDIEVVDFKRFTKKIRNVFRKLVNI